MRSMSITMSPIGLVPHRRLRNGGVAMTRPRRKAEVLPGLGARVRDLRRARGLTQERLAERANVKAETMSRIENGVNTPDLATLARIAKALKVGVPTMFLHGEVGDLTEPLTARFLMTWSELDDDARRLLIDLVELIHR